MENKGKSLKLTAEQASQEIVTGVTVGSVSNSIKAINAFQQLVRSQLKDGHDYGKVPGTDKNTLLKPGAEKIAKLLRCADKYEIIEKVEDWQAPLFSFTVKCQLMIMGTNDIVSEGIGECNSMESKYRYRWVYERDIPKGMSKEDLVQKSFRGQGGTSYVRYRIDNDDIYSQKNTIMKMAKKRALVDAALSAGRLSDIFTQDIEEVEFTPEEQVNAKPDVDAPQSKSAAAQPAQPVQPFANCESCGIEVEKIVHDYSQKKYGKVLCRECQKTESLNGRK